MIKDRRAVTLIELIMVIVVVGTLAGIISLGIIEVIDLWNFLTFNNEIASQGRIALMWIGREIRQMTFESIQVADASRLRFTAIDIDGDNNDDVIEFYRNANDELMRIFNDNPAQGDILASSVSNLTFTYYDENNGELTNVPLSEEDHAMVYRIAIALILSNSSGSRTLDLRSQIFPRNF